MEASRLLLLVPLALPQPSDQRLLSEAPLPLVVLPPSEVPPGPLAVRHLPQVATEMIFFFKLINWFALMPKPTMYAIKGVQDSFFFFNFLAFGSTSPSQTNSTFEALATQDTGPTFGNLAQGGVQSPQQTSLFGGSAQPTPFSNTGSSFG